MFYSERHRAPQAGRLAPLSSFPGSHTPHLSVKLPQPWTLYGSTCASLVHIHFRLHVAECALGYLLLCCMLLGLWKASEECSAFRQWGNLDEALEVPSALSILHTPSLSQITILFLATLWIILSFTPVLIAPNFTSIPLCSVLLLLSHLSRFRLCVVKLKRTLY